MKISSRTRYGTKALLDLALHQDEEPVSLKDIAERQQIPRHYLEQLVSRLIAAEMVRSTRGPKGGVSLVRDPGEIRISEIVQVFEGSALVVENGDSVRPVSEEESSCATHDFWCELSDVMYNLLDSTTLQDLVEKQKDKLATVGSMYYI